MKESYEVLSLERITVGLAIQFDYDFDRFEQYRRSRLHKQSVMLSTTVVSRLIVVTPENVSTPMV